MTKSDTWRRLPVHGQDGAILFFDPDEIFFVDAEGHDTLVRTARRKPYPCTRRIEDLARLFPSPPMFRCHRSYLVNLARVRSLERKGKDYRIRLDPPVNAVLPLARDRVKAFRQLMGLS